MVLKGAAAGALITGLVLVAADAAAAAPLGAATGAVPPSRLASITRAVKGQARPADGYHIGRCGRILRRSDSRIDGIFSIIAGGGQECDAARQSCAAQSGRSAHVSRRGRKGGGVFARLAVPLGAAPAHGNGNHARRVGSRLHGRKEIAVAVASGFEEDDIGQRRHRVHHSMSNASSSSQSTLPVICRGRWDRCPETQIVPSSLSFVNVGAFARRCGQPVM